MGSMLELCFADFAITLYFQKKRGLSIYLFGSILPVALRLAQDKERASDTFLALSKKVFWATSAFSSFPAQISIASP